MSIEKDHIEQTESFDAKFFFWRRIHRASSLVIAIVSLLHCALTFVLYSAWNPESVWFLGTGLGLLLLAITNIAHVGIQPCRQPTAPVVRIANWIYFLFGVGAVIAVPEPQAFLILAGLFAQALAGQNTLTGPA